MTFADGSKRSGSLDDRGYAHIEGVPPGPAKIEIGEDIRDWKIDSPDEGAPNPSYGQTLTGEQLQALYRATFGDN